MILPRASGASATSSTAPFLPRASLLAAFPLFARQFVSGGDILPRSYILFWQSMAHPLSFPGLGTVCTFCLDRQGHLLLIASDTSTWDVRFPWSFTSIVASALWR